MSQLVQLEVQPVPAQGGAGEGACPSVKFQLSLRPGHSQLTQTTRLAGLEQRLARLEQVIGATPSNMVGSINLLHSTLEKGK